MWIIEMVVGIGILIFACYGLKPALKTLRHRFFHVSHLWRQKLDHVLYRPLYIILWILGVAYLLDVLGRLLHFPITAQQLGPLRNAAIIGCLAWLIFQWKEEIQNHLIDHSSPGYKPVDAGAVRFLSRLLSIVILVVTGMIVLQIFGVNVLPLIAFGGIGAAAVGFAGKDVLANFFGGLMLYITRPFTTGDHIELPERNMEGNVEEIGWYLTAIRDKEKRAVYLPNAMFSTLLVVNISRMSHRRIEERIKLRFSDIDKIKTVTEEMRKIVAAHPLIDAHLPILIYFDTFKDAALDILIDVYSLETRNEEFLLLKEELLLSMQNVLKARGAEIPFPVVEISINPADK
jgi:MscS family membrane protein